MHEAPAGATAMLCTLPLSLRTEEYFRTQVKQMKCLSPFSPQALTWQWFHINMELIVVSWDATNWYCKYKPRLFIFTKELGQQAANWRLGVEVQWSKTGQWISKRKKLIKVVSSGRKGSKRFHSHTADRKWAGFCDGSLLKAGFADHWLLFANAGGYTLTKLKGISTQQCC